MARFIEKESEKSIKALAAAVASLSAPTAKVLSEIEYFRAAAESVGLDFDAFTPLEAVSWQTALFYAWQDGIGRDEEIASERAERDAKAAKAKLDRLEADEVADRERERKNAREAARLAERKAEREALREKFATS